MPRGAQAPLPQGPRGGAAGKVQAGAEKELLRTPLPGACQGAAPAVQGLSAEALPSCSGKDTQADTQKGGPQGLFRLPRRLRRGRRRARTLY